MTVVAVAVEVAGVTDDTAGTPEDTVSSPSRLALRWVKKVCCEAPEPEDAIPLGSSRAFRS